MMARDRNRIARRLVNALISLPPEVYFIPLLIYIMLPLDMGFVKPFLGY
jgi:hypothetical protein